MTEITRQDRKAAEEIWRLHDEKYYLAPYNIDKRVTENSFDRSHLSDVTIDWRSYLKTQFAGEGVEDAD